jgi:hypothetical protein
MSEIEQRALAIDRDWREARRLTPHVDNALLAQARVKRGRGTALERRLAYYQALVDLARAMGLPTVPKDVLSEALRGRNSVTSNKRDEWRPIKTPRNDSGKLMLFWLNWHAGKTAPMKWRWCAISGRTYSGGFESLAILAQAIEGKPNTVLERWRHLIGRTTVNGWATQEGVS